MHIHKDDQTPRACTSTRAITKVKSEKQNDYSVTCSNHGKMQVEENERKQQILQLEAVARLSGINNLWIYVQTDCWGLKASTEITCTLLGNMGGWGRGRVRMTHKKLERPLAATKTTDTKVVGNSPVQSCLCALQLSLLTVVGNKWCPATQQAKAEQSTESSKG